MTRSSLQAVPARRLIEPTYWTCPHGARQRPLEVETFGPEVAALAATAGLEPDLQQQLGLDLLFAFHPDGRPVTFEFCVICARQQLKSSLFVMAVIGWVAISEVPEIMWTAHLASTASAGMRAVQRAFLTSPALRRMLKPMKNDGFFDEPSDARAELATGQRIGFATRTRDGARGLDNVTKLILDEAFALTARQMGAIQPVLAAKPHGQMALGSSAAAVEATELRAIRDRGRAGFSSRMTYLEWLARRESCRDVRGEVNLGCRHPKNALELGIDCALDREHLMRESMPALESGRMTLEVARGLRQSMPTPEVMRELFGWWEDPKLDAPSVFGPGRWVACKPAGSAAPFPTKPAALGVAVSEDRQWTSVAACALVPVPVGEGRDEFIEVPFVAPVARFEGTRELVELLPRIQDQTECTIKMLGKGASSNLVDDIEDADAAVDLVDGDEWADACSDMYDAVRDRRLVHNGASELDDAVAAADWRPYGGRRVFEQRDPDGDISMLRAAALAVAGAGDGAFSIH